MAAPDYNFDAFAPARKREEKHSAPPLRKVEAPKKNKAELKAESRRVISRTFKAAVICITVSVLAFLNIYGYCQSDLADKEYKELQEKLEMVQSENTRLSMELNSMVSLEQIETVAVEKLGLVKLNAGDIEYVKIAEGSRVVVASGRTVG